MPTTHYMQDGAPQGFKPRTDGRCSRYPGVEVSCDVPLQAIAGHRTDAHYSISKFLDFRDCKPTPRVRAPNFPARQPDRNPNYPICDREAGECCFGLMRPSAKGWRNMQDLRQYYIDEIHCNMEEGETFVMVAIPPCVDMHHIYVYNECPVEGLEFEVVLCCPDDEELVLGKCIANECKCTKFAVPEGLDWHGTQNRIVKIRITAFPPPIDKTCEVDGKTGVRNYGGLDQACFAVAVAGVCPITGA